MPLIAHTKERDHSGYPVPAKATIGYGVRGGVTRFEETASTWTRTSITGYDLSWLTVEAQSGW